MGLKEDALQEAGLVLKSEKKGTFYDRFRNRVMFPVFDIKGRVIGFGGRVLDDSKPKYLNSPETLVFQKGTNLYGLNFAIKERMEAVSYTHLDVYKRQGCTYLKGHIMLLNIYPMFHQIKFID